MWCLDDRGVWYALLMRANKPKIAVQSSEFLFLLTPHGLLCTVALFPFLPHLLYLHDLAGRLLY